MERLTAGPPAARKDDNQKMVQWQMQKQIPPLRCGMTTKEQRQMQRQKQGQ
jgi:hypothetical protein